jgi:hypothetical protein
MTTNSVPSADAGEFCSLLERVLLKYFPQQVADFDSFLFGESVALAGVVQEADHQIKKQPGLKIEQD